MLAMRHVARTIGAIGVVGLIPTVIAQTEPRLAESQEGSSAFIRDVRRATHQFQDVTAAIAAGYVSTRNCASGQNEGAMGVHFVNEANIADGALDTPRPEVLVYEPVDGRLRLVAVEFLVDAEQWNAANAGPPVLGGQLFHYVGAPNRLRIPAHYELHVWAWKRNLNGVFSDWNPAVSCAEYTGATPAEAAGSGAGH